MKIQQVVVALEAIAQESRLGIYRLLVQASPEGLAAGRIAERMKLPPPTLSFHLAQLKRCGMVACQRHGTSLVYSANFDAMNEIVGYLPCHFASISATAAGDTSLASEIWSTVTGWPFASSRYKASAVRCSGAENLGNASTTAFAI